MTDDEILDEVIKKAQEIARKDGLKIGDKVAHPSDPIVYELFKIKRKTSCFSRKAKI